MASNAAAVDNFLMRVIGLGNYKSAIFNKGKMR